LGRLVSGAPVRTEQRGSTLLIVIDRPEKRNAVNQAVADGIAAALDRLDAEDELAVGVLSGAGGGFSSGMDLVAINEGSRSAVGDRGFAGIVRRSSHKPLIAAVEGFAVAGGLEIALACDLIVAAEGAQLGIPEVHRSLVAIGGALMRLPHRVPEGVAREMALTGDPITAERGYEVGLVDRLAPPGGALDLALGLAGRIAANGPLAIAATKRVLDQQRGWAPEEWWDRQTELTEPTMESADAREGAAAFVERREPKWSGR
jgi:enoyl-CoA hydratase